MLSQLAREDPDLHHAVISLQRGSTVASVARDVALAAFGDLDDLPDVLLAGSDGARDKGATVAVVERHETNMYAYASEVHDRLMDGSISQNEYSEVLLVARALTVMRHALTADDADSLAEVVLAARHAGLPTAKILDIVNRQGA